MELGKAFGLAEVLNILDADGADSDYFYASRLPGEPLEGVEDLHSRTVEPRTARVGIKMVF